MFSPHCYVVSVSSFRLRAGTRRRRPWRQCPRSDSLASHLQPPPPLTTTPQPAIGFPCDSSPSLWAGHGEYPDPGAQGEARGEGLWESTCLLKLGAVGRPGQVPWCSCRVSLRVSTVTDTRRINFLLSALPLPQGDVHIYNYSVLHYKNSLTPLRTPVLPDSPFIKQETPTAGQLWFLL